MALLIAMLSAGLMQRGSWAAAEVKGGAAAVALASARDQRPAAGDGAATARDSTEPRGHGGELQLGAYVTNISDIDLLEDRFSIEMLIWSLWNSDQSSDPSDSLVVINGIYDGDIQRFDQVRSVSQGTSTWALHRVRSTVVNRWKLKTYPFDNQLLHVEIGLDDPLEDVQLQVSQPDPIAVSPGLHLPGWLLKDSSAYPTSLSLMSDLGIQSKPGEPIHRQSTISFDIRIERRSLLYLAPDFLGYILAIGLCCLSLVISRSRDDLILAAVVSAAGNYVFIAGKLPVSAMAGFIGNLQIIIFFGILYVIAVDELLNEHLAHWTSRHASLLRIGLLPSYLGLTLLGVALIIPPVRS
jgi:hypothetical protein